jgi:hypothetical protein
MMNVMRAALVRCRSHFECSGRGAGLDTIGAAADVVAERGQSLFHQSQERTGDTGHNHLLIDVALITNAEIFA